jgi:hypothetical protein
MVVISGNITLIARAARMVWTCNLSSGATPGGNANWKFGAAAAAAGALAANRSASVGLATVGAVAGADTWLFGAAAGAAQHRDSESCA